MSLDVYLMGPSRTVECVCMECDHHHTRVAPEYLYERNITHNLNRMADAAGIYQHLWRPDEIGVTRASELITPLREGLAMLEGDPTHFKLLNAPNGWGLHEHLVSFVRDYLAACERHPEASVVVSR
jgi:hypothetical protein